MNMTWTLSNRLELAMMTRNFETDALSRAADVPEPFIQRILSGTGMTAVASDGPNFQRLADTLKVSVTWLCEGDETERNLRKVIDELAATRREMRAEMDSLRERISGIEASSDEFRQMLRSLTKNQT